MILHYYYSTSDKKNQVVFRYLAIFKNPLLPDRDRSAGSCIGYGIRQERGDSDEAHIPCDRRHARHANLFAVGMRHARGGSALRLERTSARTPRLAACADDPLCFGCCGRYRADHECMICRIFVFTSFLSRCFAPCICKAKPLPFMQIGAASFCLCPHYQFVRDTGIKMYPLRGCDFEWAPLSQVPKPSSSYYAKRFRALRSTA